MLIGSLFSATSHQQHLLLIVKVCALETNLSRQSLVQTDKLTLKCCCKMYCRLVNLFPCTSYVMPLLSFTTVSRLTCHNLSGRNGMPTAGGFYIRRWSPYFSNRVRLVVVHLKQMTTRTFNCLSLLQCQQICHKSLIFLPHRWSLSPGVS